MGYFLDSFGLASGVTLGSMAAQSAFQFGGQALARSFNEATAKFCAERYDPVVRDDLAHLMVLGKLEPADYPFEDKVLRMSKWKRILLGAVALFFFGWIMIGDIWPAIQLSLFYRNMRYITNALSAIFAFLVVFVLPWVVFFYAARKNKLKKMNSPTGVNAAELQKYGQQYWHVREYVRQALDLGRFTPQEGLRKLCNTALVGRFPDSTDEIEANAFFFRQKLGQ